MSSFTIIVATDKNNGIGINNQLPWHLPEDLAHFKKTTSGHPIIMGRKTFESIGRPLPNRHNIVVSRNVQWAHEGVSRVASLEEAESLVGDAEAFIIGGAQIYQQALVLAHKIIMTEIQQEYACDAFFPRINRQEWQEVSREKLHSANERLPYAIVTYLRMH